MRAPAGDSGVAPRRPVVLVDGRSGAGKTSFGRDLAPRLGAHLLSLDALYPGWGGLEAGSRAVHETVLRAVDPGYTGWNWDADRPGQWHPLPTGVDDDGPPLVIEGCGALSRANRALADLAIWIDLDDVERRRRAIARDGETYAPHWERWARQEETFAARERPRELADLVVAGGYPPLAR
ncbi:ATP-binding protein [Schumannella soli]|uniref:ATP-binding protein n=1 Tax=Schumannella soli TaxID=2590779 RepID=A0A506Y1S6_9MICO|nr:ATP-binding protein [Schumannella soli]